MQKAKNKGADQTADAQAGLHLCCSQPSEDRFSRVEARFQNMFSIIEFENVKALRRDTHARIQNVLSEGRENQNTTISRPSSAMMAQQ